MDKKVGKILPLAPTMVAPSIKPNLVYAQIRALDQPSVKKESHETVQIFTSFNDCGIRFVKKSRKNEHLHDLFHF